MWLTDAPLRSAAPAPGADGRRRLSPGAVVAVVLLVLIAGGGLSAWGLSSSLQGPPGPPPASLGGLADLRLPAAVLDAPLVDQGGRAVTLGDWRGRIVFLVPFLTSCQEVCPLTAAALRSVHRALVADRLAGRVSVVELSVDPGRDVPSRLAAYARLTGADWPMLTGSPAAVSAVLRGFGVYAQQVPEGQPPGTDWQTGRPYAYDVDHSDGFALIDAEQHERFVSLGAPNLQGRPLPAPLAALLDRQGRQNLAHPGPGAWTVQQALDAVGWLAGRRLPPAG